ncbi:lysophospholipid acyltransferase family protein [Chitinispirillales bacterium ANBcel5]|uniref:lysophospholipid acyltransferase family protein n=1 Tax=Cellulosispirillum alkaliphilum TaxID=3039283 RepID=UPI002A50039B|nr:lysophospholipid acyltransferase family protein [Chitinispirillales bacterium ANBcel5]
MKNKRLKPFRYNLLSAAVSAALFVGKRIPRSLGLFLFGLLGRFLYLIPNKEKIRAINHLSLIYGSTWDKKKISNTARNVFSGLGMNLFDAVYLSTVSDSTFNRIVKCDNLERFREAYGRKKGVFVITGHVGCFEMLLQFFARNGFKSFAIGKKMRDPRIEQIVRELRSGPGIEYFDRSEGGRKIVRFLKQGRACGVLVDQDTKKVDGVFANFLGRRAFTPSGPVRLALKFDIPMFVVTTIREPDNTHRVIISEEIVANKKNDFESELVSVVQKINDRLGETIHRYPSQWVWMHRRWKTQP